MHNFIQTNIRFLRKERGFTQETLSQSLGIKRSKLGAYEEGRANPNYDVLNSLSRLFKVTIDAMINTDLTSKEVVRTESDLQGKDLRVLTISVNESGEENVEMVPLKAAAGYMTGYSDEKFIGQLEKFNLPFLKGGTFRAFEIKGDSMYPLQEGSIVITEYVSDWVHLKEGQTYIVVSKDEGIVYKRVFNNLKEDQTLLLQSDNPSYPPFKIHANDIIEIWKAVLHISYANKGEVKTYTQLLGMLQRLNSELQEFAPDKH